MNDGRPAFPSGNKVPCGGWETEGHPGMSLRDWFAGMALQGMLAAEIDGEVWDEEKCATRCYRFANAMLREQER